jgi:hypothetical protein
MTRPGIGYNGGTLSLFTLALGGSASQNSSPFVALARQIPDYDHYTVFTGVEVMPQVQGAGGGCSGSGGPDGRRVELRVIKYQSRGVLNDTCFIKAAF